MNVCMGYGMTPSQIKSQCEIGEENLGICNWFLKIRIHFVQNEQLSMCNASLSPICNLQRIQLFSVMRTINDLAGLSIGFIKIYVTATGLYSPAINIK